MKEAEGYQVEWSDPDDGNVVITKVKEIHEAQVDAGDDNLTFIDPATRSSAGRARGCQASGSRI